MITLDKKYPNKIEINTGKISAADGLPSYNYICISDDQKALLDTLCDIEYDEFLNKWYVLNSLRFKIIPNFVQGLDKDHINERRD